MGNIITPNSEDEQKYLVLEKDAIKSWVYEIIEKSEKYCFIISPFFNIKHWGDLQRVVKGASKEEKNIAFILKNQN